MNSGKCSFTTVGASSGLNPGQERGSLARMWSERGELACDFCTSWWPRAARRERCCLSLARDSLPAGPSAAAVPQSRAASPDPGVVGGLCEGTPLARREPLPASPAACPCAGQGRAGAREPFLLQGRTSGSRHPDLADPWQVTSSPHSSHQVPGVCVWIVGDPAQPIRGH